MGKASDLVGDVIRGNLSGAESEIAKLDAQIAELEERRAVHVADRDEYKTAS
jgi:hypothetical protein